MLQSNKKITFLVADFRNGYFGRKEIEIAEHEMPGLMAIRGEFSQKKPSRE